MRTSIVIPIIRPEKAERCIDLVYANAGVNLSSFEIISEEDTDRIGCPKMVAKLVARSNYETVMFIGDDCLPQPDFLLWAQVEMMNFPGEWGLVGLNDNTNRVDLPTHWLAHKKLLSHLGGEFFHTGYTHCCCDVELAERCKELDRYVYSKRASVFHEHPMLQKGVPMDADYTRVYSDEIRGADRRLLAYRREHSWGGGDT